MNSVIIKGEIVPGSVPKNPHKREGKTQQFIINVPPSGCLKIITCEPAYIDLINRYYEKYEDPLEAKIFGVLEGSDDSFWLVASAISISRKEVKISP